jgi:hypothetical protein
MSDQLKGFRFQPGRAKTGGRQKGTRDKLSSDFVAALSEAFEQRGAEAIRIVIDERPQEFLRVIASIVPKEIEFTDNRLKDIPDEELDAIIDHIRRQLAGSGDAESGETATAH